MSFVVGVLNSEMQRALFERCIGVDSIIKQGPGYFDMLFGATRAPHG